MLCNNFLIGINLGRFCKYTYFLYNITIYEFFRKLNTIIEARKKEISALINSAL